MKLSYLVLLLLLLSQPVAVDQPFLATDSLKRLLMETRLDTSRVMLLSQLSVNYLFFRPDSSLWFAQQAMRLANRLNFPKGKVRALNIYGEVRRFRGEFPQALAAQFQALQLSKNRHYPEGEERCMGTIGMIYLDLDQYRQALAYLFQAKTMNESRFDEYLGSRWLSGIGYAYERLNRLDSALIFQQQAHRFSSHFPANHAGTLISTRLGVVQSRLGHFNEALRYFQDAIKSSFATADIVNRGRTQYRIADLYHTANQPDSSLHYARLAFINGNLVLNRTTILDASNLLVKLYQATHHLDSAFHYQQVATATKDSLYGREKFQQFQLLTLTEQQRQQALVAAQKDYQNKIRLYALLAGLAVLLLLAGILWLNNQQRQKANQLLHRQKEEIDVQRTKAETTLIELKATQAQLIQQEKMASLGELTAGIAHEIQNPLNFVNNFAELVEELKEEIDKQTLDKAYFKGVLDDLAQNQQKIHHHGQRADAIVKGMLQHSRASSGEATH